MSYINLLRTELYISLAQFETSLLIFGGSRHANSFTQLRCSCLAGCSLLAVSLGSTLTHRKSSQKVQSSLLSNSRAGSLVRVWGQQFCIQLTKTRPGRKAGIMVQAGDCNTRVPGSMPPRITASWSGLSKLLHLFLCHLSYKVFGANSLLLWGLL